MSIDGLPPLRDVIERHGLQAKKSLGQNFLLDLNLTGKIARAAGDLSQTTVIEVGPGPGGLTRALLMHGARRVIAIERDERCLAALAEIAAHYPGRLEVIAGDALKTDFAALAGGGPDTDRRQPALQYRHRAAGALADGPGVAALLPVDDADVPARGCRAHRRQTGRRQPTAGSACSPAGGRMRGSPSTCRRRLLRRRRR